MSDNSPPGPKAIGGPKDGKYYILYAGDPKLIVGVDGVGEPWVPVITDGKNNVFTVKKEGNGHYTLILEDGEIPQFIQDDGGKLVGNERPPASGWIINGKDCGPYTIEVPGPIWPTLNWNLTSLKPKSPVVLLRRDFPELWNFVPWIGPESK